MIDKIWLGQSPYIIAEVSQNHDGSLGQAHAFIDAVAQTGVDAIKFQTHIAEEESTIYEPFRVKFSYEDNTRYEYWKRMEFTTEQWKGLADHAKEKNLDFISSPFSIKALEILDRIGVPAWKFGAGEIFNDSLFRKALGTGKPILVSTGLSTYLEIDSIVDEVKTSGNQFLLFQCVTAYPSTAEMIDIRQITEMQKRYQCPVGISDHSATIYPALAAAALGAKAVEVHVTMSPYMFGPDVKASVTIEQLKQIVEGCRYISIMRQTHANMNCRDENREKLKNMFSKGLYLTRDVHKGDILTENMLAPKKPNMGIDSAKLGDVIGKIILRDIKKNEPLKYEYIQ